MGLKGFLSSQFSFVVTCQDGLMVSGEYRTSYCSRSVLMSFGSPQCKISSASMVWTCERLTGGAGFTGGNENNNICRYKCASKTHFQHPQSQYSQ